MPEVYTELTAPTAVSFSLKLPFTSASAEDLIVARTSLLQIFAATTHETDLSQGTSSKEEEIDRRVLDSDQEQSFGADIALQRSQVESFTKLALVGEYNLSGSVTGLQRIKLLSSKSGGEALLIAFKDAKLSLLEWDPVTHGLSTISIHYYEREEFQSPVVPEGLPSSLVADPASRCAALRFGGDMVAILPFRRREDEALSLGNAADGHDLDMTDGDDDWDPAAPGGGKKLSNRNENASPTGEKQEHTPTDRLYHPSFVLSASQLDDAITHIISFAFLHEYREPTFGILYSPRRTWSGLLAADGRRDTVSYIVITVDLEQKASTPIMSVSDLPYDIFKVVPLAPPIGGSLLVGENELIHVDQAGKSTGVAVNGFSKKSTGFPGLTDQSDLCLELEGSVLVELEGEEGDLLLLTKKGEGVIVGFKMDGRSVSGVKVTPLSNHPESLIGGRATTVAALGSRRLFVGCLEGDARVLGWKRKGEKKKAGDGAKEEVLENEDEEDMYKLLEDMDDDLYGGGNDTHHRKDSMANGGTRRGNELRGQGEYIFQTHDRLVNLGPFRDMALGKPAFPEQAQKRQRGVVPELEIVTTSGPTNTTEDAGISVIRKSIAPTVVGRFEFSECQALWTVCARSTRSSTSAPGIGGEESQRNAEDDFDRFLFVSKSEESQVFKVGDTFEEVKRGTDFDSDGETIEVGVVGGGARIVQVVGEQVRVYDCDLQLAQIIPMFDEETGEEGPNIVRARVCDPYVLLVRADGSVIFYKVDMTNLELTEEERRGPLKTTKFISGSIFMAKKGEFIPTLDGSPVKEEFDNLCFLLTAEGGLQIWNLEDLSAPVLVIDRFNTLPPLLSTETTAHTPRFAHKEAIIEILVANIGDQFVREPYLIARSTRNDITFYKPFIAPASSTLNGPTLRFIKSSNPRIAIPANIKTKEKPRFRAMIAIDNIGGYAAVFVPGSDPSFIIKTAKSIPRVHKLAGRPVRSLSSFHTAGADRGFVYVDISGIVRVSLLPTEFCFDTTWPARKVYLNEKTQAIAYFPPMSVYVVSTTKREPFDLAEEDGSVAKDESSLQPEIDSGAIKLVSPLNWSVVDQYQFGHNEIALVVKTIELEVSEHTKERKQLVTVGTGIFRGEDFSARGGIYVFEIIEVVPEPGRPETNRKLKLVAREDVKGTVSAICGVNGYLLAAQGQKIMVRGLKEDQSLLPVAFMDMNMYVTVAKNLNGMILFGDFMKSIWFTGFSEEPYKMTLFGKDTQKLEVVAADFLPDGNQLFFVVADADSNVHILQYDPEHPKSLAGQRLIRRADFYAGHEIRTLTMLPRFKASKSPIDPDSMDTSSDSGDDEFLVLVGTQTGALAMITTLPEASYRRLNIVQGAIINGEEHTAGLNPRGYRDVGASQLGGDLLRSVLDGVLVSRWVGLSEVKKAEISAKAGTDTSGMREELKAQESALLYF
ncbi:mRNA cleavage and polyadenylation factor subunit [Rhizina undulata]